jgi:GT2 family glycosyltransferase
LDRGADIDFLWRVWRAGKRIHCCEQFTVIKIPSARIGLYALVEEPPQVRYWRRVQSGWPNFQQELLGTAGAELAKCRMGHPPFKAAAARALVIAGHEFRQATEDLPFFFQTWRWFFQRRRRTILAKRGLPRTFLARKAD